MQLEYGRGFTLVAGHVGWIRYDRRRCRPCCYRGIGCSSRRGRGSQNAKGDVLGPRAFDLGLCRLPRPQRCARLPDAGTSLEFHTDVVDIVGLLMCLRAAREGGHSVDRQFDDECTTRCWPASRLLLGLLYGNFLFDRRGEEVDGEHAVFRQPGLHRWYQGLSELPSGGDRIHLFGASRRPGSSAERGPATRRCETFLGHALRAEDLQSRHGPRAGRHPAAEQQRHSARAHRFRGP